MEHLSKLNQKYLLVPKVLYTTLSAVFYTFHQFRGQFILDRYGVEKDSLGLYLSGPQSISFLATIGIGSINDRSGQQRGILLGLLLASAVFFQTFFFTKVASLFWICFTFYFVLLSSTLPLLDKVMFDYVTEIPGMGPRAFGTQRIWSTFGYLATNFIIEHFISKDKLPAEKYDNMQYCNIVFAITAAIFIFLFVKNLPRRTSNNDYYNSMKALLKNFEYIYFIGIILLCGISRAFMTNYLGIYYSKVLKFDNQENPFNVFWPMNILTDLAYNHKQSTSTFFGVALEIIIFYNSSRVSNRLGLFWPILLSQIFQLLRFIAYYNLSYENSYSFAYCCLIELMKGANYSLIHVSALQLANSFCPPHLRTTSQLIYNGVFVALGTALAGVFFKSFFTPGIEDVEMLYGEFNVAFKWNIVFSIIGLLFFVCKYGIHENLLFNRDNADRKIREIETSAEKTEEESLPQEPAKVSVK